MPTAWPGHVVVRAVDVEKVGGKNLKTCFKTKKNFKTWKKRLQHDEIFKNVRHL